MVAVTRSGALTAQLLDVHTGSTQAELPTDGGFFVRVTADRFVRTSAAGFEGVDRAGAVHWTVPRPAGIETGSAQVVGDDLVVTTHGTCGTD